MKQFAKIFCLSAVFLIFAGMTVRADYREVDGKKVVCPEYIIEENFFTTYSLKSKPFQVSGWNVNSAAGDAISANPLKIVDASEALPIIMERPIPLQTDDVLTFETCFNMISPIDNTRFQFKYEDKLLFEIVYKNQSLVFHGADERILISELAGNIVLKADINLAEQTVNIYINGKYVLKDGIFEEKINQMDSFVILTGEKEKGCMQISPVLLYKGYFVNELFLPYAGGGLPYGWIEPGKENKLATEPIPNNKTIDGECVHLISKSPVAATAVRKEFEDFSGSTAVRCFMNFEDSEYGAGVKLLKNEKCVGSLVSDGKNFCWISGGKKTVIKPIRCDFWYDLKIVADNKSKKAKVYINLQEIDAELYLEDSINGVEFTSSLTGNKGAWLDDVTVFPVLPLPEDYVPKPQPQEKTDDYYVGLQSCNLYKEGSGLGWNYIKMAQERESIIGYYDEGKPEVADWETKWLSEHGIDFQMYCWFRGGVKWGAIKRPAYSAALHEGFLNSEYKSNMKFAVMFENAASQVSSLNDFKTCVVPYWIEYYFTNPSYFVIDNKPVVAIYQIGQFASQIGGRENGIDAIKYLKQECIKAGFDGAYFLLLSTSSKTSDLKNWQTLGFDGVYAYNWNTDSAYPEEQQKRIEAQTLAYPQMAIPTVAAGWDASVTGGISGRFLTADELYDMIDWTKKNIRSKIPESGLGSKILMLANLTEFGEGTIVYPTKNKGFELLDAVKSALITDDTAHTDEIPTKEQEERVSRMYDASLPVYVNPYISEDGKNPPPTDCIIKEWTFENGTGDFKAAKHIKNLRVEDKVLKMDIIGDDPQFTLSGINEDCNEIDYIRIVMKNNTDSTTGAIYFNTNKLRVINELKSYRFKTEPNSSEWKVYDIYVGANKQWDGLVDMIRFDPVSNSLGNIEIKSIQLLRSQKTMDTRIKVNGNAIVLYEAPERQNGSIMVSGNNLFKAIGGYADFYYKTGVLKCVYNNTVFEFSANSDTVIVNNEKKKLAVVPRQTSKSILIPLRFVCETLGLPIEWDEASNTANIISGVQSDTDTDSIKAWEFNNNGDSEGWSRDSGGNLFMHSPLNGTLRALVVGNDPNMSVSAGLGMDCSQIKSIVIRMKNNTDSESGRMYFATDKSTTLNESKSFGFNVSTDGEFHEYVIDTDKNSQWQGKLKQLRFDPVADTTGEVEIDYIRLK